MDPASLALSSASICIKLFKDLRSRVGVFNDAEQSVSRYVLYIEHHSAKVQEQMQILQRVWHLLPERLQMTQCGLLQLFQGELQKAIIDVDALIGKPNEVASSKTLLAKDGSVKRLKLATGKHSKLEEIVKTLESLERRFDPTWFLAALGGVPGAGSLLTATNKQRDETAPIEQKLAYLSSPTSDGIRQAAGPIFISSDTIIAERSAIVRSTVQISEMTVDGGTAIVDARTTYWHSYRPTVVEDVRTLARALQECDPMTFGLLRCRGVIKTDDKTALCTTFEFVFEVPSVLKRPRSLRALLLEERPEHPLDERVRLAKLMTKSVAFVHNIKVVHKKVAPDTFLVFGDDQSLLGTPFLVGFEKFRFAQGITTLSGDDTWEANLYRHPRRQGIEPEEYYNMQHDIYSLGVCLLEIGLWQSFVVWSTDPEVAEPSTAISLYSQSSTRDVRQKAFETKNMFVNMAKELLPLKIGTRYANVVLDCLTCLDKDNERFGDEEDFEDEDGILVGVRFIEKILMQLEDVSL